MIIRKAELGDIARGIEMVRAFYSSAFKEMDLAFDEKEADKLCQILVKDNLAIVAIDKDKVIGAIAGMITPYIFDPGARMFQETVWYVDESYRNGPLPIRLIHSAEDYCKEHNIRYCLMASLGNRRDESLAKLYGRRGYKHFETTYIKTIGE